MLLEKKEQLLPSEPKTSTLVSEMFSNHSLRAGTVHIRMHNSIQRTVYAYTALCIYYVPGRVPFEHFALSCMTLMQASPNSLQNKSQQM